MIKKNSPQKPMATESNTKKLAAIGLFVAVAIVLNRTIVIPAPYLSFLSYEVWEIPLVVAFLAFGVEVAVPAAFINFFALLLFPGVILAGPLYNLIAILAMLLGIGFAEQLLKLRPKVGMSSRIVLATALGITMRVVIMTIVNETFLQMPQPLGFSAPASLVVAWLPLIAFFNATVSLYTIPIAYLVFKAVSSRGSWKARMPVSSEKKDFNQT